MGERAGLNVQNSRLVVSEKTRGGRLNVSPVLSPGGRQMLFFSEKDLARSSTSNRPA